MANGPFLRKYGVSATINFELFEVDGVNFRVDAVHAAGDTVIMKDEGAEANTTNGFTDEGTGYSLVLTATEMQAARIVIYVVDQTATKVWLDKAIIIDTYGNASAQHAVDLDDSVRAGLTALPNAAAGAAGGLPTDSTGKTSFNDLSAAQVNTEADTALSDFFTSAANLVDLIWDEVLTGATHNVTNSAGKRLRQIDAAFEVHSGTAQSGTVNTITLDTGASATDDIYSGDRIIIVGGTGAQEHGIVTGYNGTTKVATMSKNWVITPDNTSEFEVVPADVDVETWENVAVSNGATSNLPVVDAQAVSDSTTAADNVEANIGNLDASIATVDTVVDGIQTDLSNSTDGLGALKLLIDALDAVADAIKAKTDSLTFTVAGQVDSNIQSINNVTITGDGSATPFDV